MLMARVFAVGVVLVGLFFAWVHYGRAQERPRMPRADRRVSLSHIEDRARAARTGDPASVRALTDELFARSSFASAAESLKDRIYRSELAFRNGTQAGVSEANLVVALNLYLHPIKSHIRNGAAVMRTSVGQIHLFREFTKRYIPTLSHRGNEPLSGDLEPELSPAEVAFVAMHLITQKLVNPEYQVAPEKWEADIAERKARFAAQQKLTQTPEAEREPQIREPQIKAGQLTSRTIAAPPEADVAAAMRREIADESSLLVSAAHAFLDSIAIQR